MAIIGIGICIGENLLLGIGIGSVGIFLYRWNPTYNWHKTPHKHICTEADPAAGKGRGTNRLSGKWLGRPRFSC